MHPAQRLYRLQETDMAITQVERQLGEIAAALGESEQVAAAQQIVAASRAELKTWHARLRDGELEVKAVVGKIETSEEQLYGGRVRNPKELKSLQEELQSLQRRRAALEDEVLEAMVEVEQLQERLKQQESAHDQLADEWRASQAKLLAEQDALGQKRSQLQSEFAARAEQVGSDLRLYEDLRRRKAGRPVAVLKDGVCQACGMALPTGEVQSVKYGDELSLCSSCGRVLWAR